MKALREGRDFARQAELEPGVATETAWRAVNTDAARLAMAIIEELALQSELGGGGDLTWSQRPAWRVGLWRTWREALGQAVGRGDE